MDVSNLGRHTVITTTLSLRWVGIRYRPDCTQVLDFVVYDKNCVELEVMFSDQCRWLGHV